MSCLLCLNYGSVRLLFQDRPPPPKPPATYRFRHTTSPRHNNSLTPLIPTNKPRSTPPALVCMCHQVRVCFRRLVRLLQVQLLELDALGITLGLRHLAQLGAADTGCRVSGGGGERGVRGRGAAEL